MIRDESSPGRTGKNPTWRSFEETRMSLGGQNPSLIARTQSLGDPTQAETQQILDEKMTAQPKKIPNARNLILR
jgi:hypothetical protein